MHKSNQLLTLE